MLNGNIDEELVPLETSFIETVQVDYFLLILILFSAVVTKLLRKASEPFSVWVCLLWFHIALLMVPTVNARFNVNACYSYKGTLFVCIRRTVNICT